MLHFTYCTHSVCAGAQSGECILEEIALLRMKCYKRARAESSKSGQRNFKSKTEDNFATSLIDHLRELQLETVVSHGWRSHIECSELCIKEILTFAQAQCAKVSVYKYLSKPET